MCRSISSGKGVLGGGEEEVLGLEVELVRAVEEDGLEEPCEWESEGVESVDAEPPGPERPIGMRPRELPSLGG